MEEAKIRCIKVEPGCTTFASLNVSIYVSAISLRTEQIVRISTSQYNLRYPQQYSVF